MEQKNIQVEVQGKNVLPTPIKNLRELTTEVTQAGADATEAKALAEVNTEIVADKDYDTTKFSGMGRVNLQKNIVDGHNYLTQEMVSKPNTIYKIQYDYEIAPVTNSSVARLDQNAVIATFNYRYAIVEANVGNTITINPSLGDAIVYMENGVWTASDIDAHTPSIVVTESMTNVGVGSRTKGLQEVINYTRTTKSIIIPENCVLEFEGGSLRNGVVVGQNTYIRAGSNILFYNINFSGTWKPIEWHSNWFNTINEHLVCDIMNTDTESVLYLDSDITMDGRFSSRTISHFSLIGNGYSICNLCSFWGITGSLSIDNVSLIFDSNITAAKYTWLFRYNKESDGSKISITVTNIKADGNNYVAGIVNYYNGYDCVSLIFDNNKCYNFTRGIVNISAEVTGSVSNNIIERIGFNDNEVELSKHSVNVFRLGVGYTGDASANKHCHNMTIENNSIINTISKYNDVNDGRELHAILCYGTYITVCNNELKTLSTTFNEVTDTGQDSEILYIKGSNCLVSNNYIEDGVGHDSDAAINLKIAGTENNTIEGNTIVYNNILGYAIRANGNNTVVSNNRVLCNIETVEKFDYCIIIPLDANVDNCKVIGNVLSLNSAFETAIKSDNHVFIENNKISGCYNLFYSGSTNTKHEINNNIVESLGYVYFIRSYGTLVAKNNNFIMKDAVGVSIIKTNFVEFSENEVWFINTDVANVTSSFQWFITSNTSNVTIDAYIVDNHINIGSGVSVTNKFYTGTYKGTIHNNKYVGYKPVVPSDNGTDVLIRDYPIIETNRVGTVRPDKELINTGFVFFDQSIGKFIYKKGESNAWYEFDGARTPATGAAVRYGTSANRPNPDYIYNGFVYFDTTLGKPIYWTGTAWVDGNGYEPTKANVQRAGLITNRPALADIYAGFMYLVTQPWEDATLGTSGPAGPYYFDGSANWILADGTTKQDGQMPARS